MKINIVCYEDTKSWILGKFALKLQEELLAIPGVECMVSDRILSGYDIVHHIIYIADFEPNSSLNTTMVTHVDEKSKISRLKKLIDKKVIGICMSEDTQKMLISQGCDQRFLKVVHPAHEFDVKRKKINLLITSRLYDDGRKNEKKLLEIFKEIEPTVFKLTIMGAGWDQVVKKIKSYNIEVEYHEDFNKEIYCGLFSSADYFLYLGHDEGSMGYLDALNAGVTPLVTNQGFHKDLKIKDGIYFDSFSDLEKIISSLEKKYLNRIQMVESLSWKTYARRHYELWNELLNIHPLNSTAKNQILQLSGLKLRLKMNYKRVHRFIRRVL